MNVPKPVPRPAVPTPTPSHGEATPPGGGPPDLKMASLDFITDFFCWDSDKPEDFEDAFCFLDSPIPRPVAGTEVGDFLFELLQYIRSGQAGISQEAVNAQINYRDKYIFRLHRDRTVQGIQLCIRRVQESCPQLEDLSFVNPYWRPLMLHPSLTEGGLVVFASKPGSGKSTTLAGMCRSRMQLFGGFGKSVESPPELPLQNEFGKGVFFQIPVDETLPQHEQFARPLRELLRGYPSIPGGGRTILVVGEVRDPETAALVVQGAVGHLVVTTLHAITTDMACARLASMAGEILGHEVARDMVASSLRLVISQRLETNASPTTRWNRKKIAGELLFSHSYYSRTAQAIRKGEFANLANVQKDQTTTMSVGAERGDPANEIYKQLAQKAEA